jgi:hypothetical protein
VAGLNIARQVDYPVRVGEEGSRSVTHRFRLARLDPRQPGPVGDVALFAVVALASASG